jgi:hypothetical protein
MEAAVIDYLDGWVHLLDAPTRLPADDGPAAMIVISIAGS